MKRVKIFLVWSCDGLEKAVNTWLSENPDKNIYDIKFDMCTGKKTENEYGAMIIYS